MKTTMLPGGKTPWVDVDFNFTVEPTHTITTEMTAREGVPLRTFQELVMESVNSNICRGIVRETFPDTHFFNAHML